MLFRNRRVHTVIQRFDAVARAIALEIHLPQMRQSSVSFQLSPAYTKEKLANAMPYRRR